VIVPDDDLHRHAPENIARANALIFGRVTYEMMEAAFRMPAPTETAPVQADPFARTIDAAKKFVVSSTLDQCAVIWQLPCSSSSASRGMACSWAA